MKNNLLIYFFLLLIAASSGAGAQVVSTVAGNGIMGFGGDGGPSAASSFYRPVYMIKDAAGNLYISDFYNYRIRRISTAGVISTFAGNGSGSSFGDGGPATAAGINSPSGMVFDAAGNMYVADASGHRIRKIDVSGTITTIAGTGSFGFSGDGGPATAAQLHTPEGLAIDASGNLYVADIWNARIRRISTSGIITTVAGDGSGFYTGDGGPATAAGIHLPVGVAVDNSGNIFIGEVGTSAIRKVNTSGIISTVAGTGTNGFSGDGGPATAAMLNGSRGISVDLSGNLYIADQGNTCIRKVDASGTITTIAGVPGSVGFTGDGGPATAAKFSSPAYAWSDNSGNIYIADVNNDRVRVIAAPIAAIGGPSAVCVGSSISLTESASGGLWTSSNSSVATVGSSTGIVTGIATGVDTIYYTTLSGAAFTVITVNATPSAITGYLSVCPGTSSTLSSSPSGGTWTSGATSVATIGSSSGTLAGVGAGTSAITYTLPTGCSVTATATVVPLPCGPLSMPLICVGTTGTIPGCTVGGVWTSSSTGVATIGSSSGLITGIGSGTTTITYTYLPACALTFALTVNPSPAGISGPSAVCAGSSITLSDITSGGVWTATNANATVGSASGVVTGATGGIDTIRYTLSSGCFAAKTISVNASPGPISGPSSVCIGDCVTETALTSGGTWTSSSTSIVTVGSSTGVVCAGSTGVATISYTLGTGCFSTLPVTVNPLPSLATVTGGGAYCAGGTGLHIGLGTSSVGTSYELYRGGVATGTIISGTGSSIDFGLQTIAGTYTVVATVTATGCTRTMSGSVSITVNPLPAISGPSAFCPGGSGTLTGTPSGGVWTSSNPSVATIGSASGSVTGSSSGTAVISYTSLSTGCVGTMSVTVSPSVGAISGSTNICTSATSTLASTTPGGIWTSSNITIAAIGSLSGIVTGVAPGTAIITYSLGTTCTATATVNIFSSPASVTGPSTTCVGSTITLSDATPSGTWSSSAPGIATVSGGVVTGTGTGTVTISYTVGTCSAIKTVTVYATPSTISGASSVCVGLTTTLSNLVSGGIWTSSNTAVATVGSATGDVTGIGGGTVIITYAVGTCTTTKAMTVNASAPITGTAAICAGSSTTLADATPGGTWASGTSSVATVVSGTGVVTGVTPGTSVITYFISGGCSVTRTVTVYAVPSAIAGVTSVCVGDFAYLSDATSGGVWTSTNTAVATVGTSSGTVSGISVGITTISYTIGSCAATLTVSVVSTPSAISGAASVCVGQSTTLSNTVSGGTWSLSDPSVASIGSSTGTVTGIATGSVIITYTVATGCRVIMPFNVNPLAPITGPADVCIGQVITLVDTALGGSWSSSAPLIASVGITTGTVTGLATGTAIISYTLPSGCIVSRLISVNALPAAITPSTVVCVGQSSALSDPTPGGSWTSATPGVATVSGLGVVTGVTAGTATISYTIGTGCAATTVVTVNALPPAISGAHDVCLGSTITLTNAVSGGVWSSSAPGLASVGSATGIVSGITLGAATITYMISTGCYVTHTVNIDSFPGPIAGTLHFCAGSSVSLSDPAPGGTWSSSNPAVAAIDPLTGVATGNAGGTAIISYSIGSGCTVVAIATVTAVPPAITGSTSTTICQGTSATLSDAIPGGAWSSSDLSVATVGSLSGLLSGVAPGAAVITYTLGGICATSTVIFVDPAPAPITGINSVCVSSATALSDATAGGTWSSLAPATAPVSSGGIVTGLAAGTATIVYTLPTGCLTTRVVSVNTFPAPISGPSAMCVGSSVTLSDPSPGGTWSGSDFSIATVTATSGIVTGVTAGTATITYSRGVACSVIQDVTINPLPAPVTGPSYVCQSQTITLADATPGGTWSSASPTIGSINSFGDVTGITPGTTLIYYTNGFGCSIATAVTVNAMPAPIGGSLNVCLTGTATLTNSIAGGTWVSLNTAIATVGSASGIVTGIAPGTATIAYTLPAGCFVSVVVTVHALPTPFTITGGGSFCPSGSGVHIGLSGSSSGVNYLLYLGSSPLGTFPGTGGPIDFGLLTVGGSYTATGTAVGTTCTVTMTGTVTVTPLTPSVPHVSVTATPGDTVCSGSVASFTPVPVHGGTAPVYNWYVNGLPVSSSGTYSYIPADGDIVSVIMHSNDTCPIPDTALGSLAMHAIPSVAPVVNLFTNPNDTVCAGTPVTISPVPYYGGTAPVYEWYKNGVSMGSGIPFAFTPANGDNVFCIMTSNYPCRTVNKDTSSTVTFYVQNAIAPTVFISAVPGTTVAPGTSVTLTAMVSGATSPTFQWYVNSTAVAGATGSSFTSASFHDGDSVSCQVTSHNICTVSGYSWIFMHVHQVGVSGVGISDIAVLPNPNRGVFNVSGTVPAGDVQLSISDMLGREIYARSVDAGTGALSHVITLGADIADGVYMLTLRSGTDVRTFRISVVR